MKMHELFESRNMSCIVVDVQPEYTGINDGDELPWVDEMMQFLNIQGPILMFVNAEDQGLTGDTVQDIKLYWEDSGFDPAKWQSTQIVDKGYGYLRGWMDYEYMTDRAIVQTIREMYRQKVADSRDLFGGEDEPDYLEKMSTLGVPTELVETGEMISVEWTSVGQLKQFSGAYIMGGGRNECLREVELLMNAFNIKYKRLERFVYG
jgi:hypothetical protein